MGVIATGLEIAYVIVMAMKLQLDYVYIASGTQSWTLFNPFSMTVANLAQGLTDILRSMGKMPELPPYSTVPKF